MWMDKRAGVALVLAGLVAAGAAVAFAQPLVPSGVQDFYFRGSQPLTPGAPLPPPLEGEAEGLVEAGSCKLCHGNQGFEEEWPDSNSPYERWRYSMMAQAYRDPVFQAQLHIAEKDAVGSSDACLRCHAPVAWQSNRVALPYDPADLFPTDTDGVSCSICHRSVDPDNKPGAPVPDLEILQALGSNRPVANGALGPAGNAASQGHLVIDPKDRRRGPFDLGPAFGYHQWEQSQWHRESGLCITCHDISNPVFSKQVDGSYMLNAPNQPHPTGNKYDMYPLDRLGSEWMASAFASGPVTQTIPGPGGTVVGRFGGVDRVSYASCQDCHMPTLVNTGCLPIFGQPIRQDYPQHNFQGGNTWVIRAVGDLFDPLDSNLDDYAGNLDVQGIDEAVERNKEMLRRASDLEVKVIGSRLRARIINESGHRLPGGFSEGTAMWLNVKFFGPGNTLVQERGAYNPATAELTRDSKVYEAKQGVDATMALLTGLPVGPSFHLDVNNKMFFDNRIPPRGFSNAGFAQVQAAPVGYVYADGQHWDDTLFDIPAGTARAEVRVFYQTTTKEYIEWLRDNADKPANSTTYIKPPAGSTATTLGQVVHEQWVKWGRSTPVEMDVALTAARRCAADMAGPGQSLGADGELTADDIIVFLNFFFGSDALADIAGPGQTTVPDGEFTADDIIVFLNGFFAGC